MDQVQRAYQRALDEEKRASDRYRGRAKIPPAVRNLDFGRAAEFSDRVAEEVGLRAATAACLAIAALIRYNDGNRLQQGG